MLQRRFGQILVGVVGATGLLLGLAGSAHAAQGTTASDESSTSVSIQNNNSGTGVSVSNTGSSTVTAGSTANVTNNPTGQPTVTTPLINVNTTNDSPVSTGKSDLASAPQAVGASQNSTDSPQATAADSSDNNPSSGSGVAAAQTDTTQPTMTVVKADGTSYQATKLVQHTGATTLGSTQAVPAAASSSQTPPKSSTPLLPQGAVADAPAQVASAGRASGGALPIATIEAGSSIHLVIILSLALTLLLVAGSFISQLRASGYAHAPRGATILLSQFASLMSGFNMSSQLKLNPLFVESNQPVAAGWRVRGE